MRVDIEANDYEQFISVRARARLKVSKYVYIHRIDKHIKLLSNFARLNKVKFDNTSKVVRVSYDSLDLHSCDIHKYGFKFKYLGPDSEYITIPAKLCNAFEYLPCNIIDGKNMFNIIKIKFPSIEISKDKLPVELQGFDRTFIDVTILASLNDVI